jgi:DNA replication protein DnaC
VRRWAEVFIVPRYRNMTFDNYRASKDNVAAFKACRRYAASYTGATEGGILLIGPPGTGKTHLAVSVARTIANRGHWPIVKFWPAVCEEMREAFKVGQGIKPIKDQLAMRNLFILDDIGAEAPSDWSAEFFLSTINHRYEQTLPTVLTTNLSPGQLVSRYGERTFSRLSEMCDVYAVEGVDHRLKRRGGAA